MKRSLPKGKLTIERLLVTCDMRECLNEIQKVAPDVKDFIFGFTTKEDSSPRFIWNGTRERILWILKMGETKLISDLFAEENKNDVD